MARNPPPERNPVSGLTAVTPALEAEAGEL